MNIVITIILLTILVSVTSWRKYPLQEKFIGHPYSTYLFGEWYRLLSAGFMHADQIHLAFNLLSFYSFASVLNSSLFHSFGEVLKDLMFLCIYFGGILLANLVTYFRHRHQPYYYHLGASAGVVAIMTAAILYNPGMSVNLLFLSIPINGMLYLVGYLFYSFLSRNRDSRVGHLAHFVGGAYAVLFLLLTQYSTIKNTMVKFFGG
ncbi:MAG: rhomboid family intramembrane serine protease [Bacteroidota bacterium]